MAQKQQGVADAMIEADVRGVLLTEQRIDNQSQRAYRKLSVHCGWRAKLQHF
jgi:hypothetical protein